MASFWLLLVLHLPLASSLAALLGILQAAKAGAACRKEFRG
jgi:hypothetical protein